MRWLPLFTLILLAAAACGRSGPFAAGEDALLQGRVTGIDSSAMEVDGDGLVFLHDDIHGSVTIRVPAHPLVCKDAGRQVYDTLAAGDAVRARGRAAGPREVIVCGAGVHFLERID